MPSAHKKGCEDGQQHEYKDRARDHGGHFNLIHRLVTRYFAGLAVDEHLEDFADMAGIEFLLIDRDTRLSEFKKELRWNEAYYLLAKGF